MTTIRHWITLLENVQSIILYRGVSTISKKGGKFFTPDKDFAMQFTQSGRECELLIVETLSSDIFRPAEPVYGGDFDEIDGAVVIARNEGFKAVWLDEGQGQPDSVYMFSISGIKRVIQRPRQ